MFDRFQRPSQKLPGVREGWVTSLAFGPIADILNVEPLRVAFEARDGRFIYFLQGLQLTRELLLARTNKGYTEMVARAAMTIFVKAVNDLLGACLLMRAGYPLQSILCLRAAFETFELMEYLGLHPEQADVYVSGKPPFDRNLSWIRIELPATDERQKAYSYFNYFAHANYKGLNIYITYDAQPGVVALHVGPSTPYPEIVPFAFASALLAYGTRTLWRMDTEVATDEWVKNFAAFDRGSAEVFAGVPEPQPDNPKS